MLDVRRSATAAMVVAAVLVAVVAAGACESTRGRKKPKDWRAKIPFSYPVAMDRGIAEPGWAVWGTHIASLSMVSSAGGTFDTVVVAMSEGHACAPGPLRRFVLEAGEALVAQQIARVTCREPGQPADGPSDPALDVEVTGYLTRVAHALGYSFDAWVDKGFEFRGTVRGPGYLDKSFSDRFAFLRYTMSEEWNRRTQFGPMVPELSTRRERTVLVVSFSDCELEGWRFGWFLSGENRGSDLVYQWVTGGGRYVVCDGPLNRYLLAMPRELAELGLTDVKGYTECILDSLEEHGGPTLQDHEYSCN